MVMVSPHGICAQVSIVFFFCFRNLKILSLFLGCCTAPTGMSIQYFD